MRFSSLVLLVSGLAVSVNGCSAEKSTIPDSVPADLHGNYSGPIGGTALSGETITGTLSLSLTGNARSGFKGTFALTGTISGTPEVPVSMTGTAAALVDTDYWSGDLTVQGGTEVFLLLTDSANPTCLHEIRGAYHSADRSIHYNDGTYLAITPTSDCTLSSHVFPFLAGYVSPV